MKNLILKIQMKMLSVILLLTTVAPFPLTAQVFEYPRKKASTTNQARIEKIEITDEQTIFTIEIFERSTRGIFISSKTHIIPSDGGDPLYIQGIDDLELDKMYADLNRKSKKYKFYFPKIDQDVSHINFRSGEEGNYWHFFEINITRIDLGVPNTVVSQSKGYNGSCFFIEKPGYTAKGGRNFEITKIELCEDETILHFTASLGGSRWVYIPEKSCIRDSRGGENLFVNYVESTMIASLPMDKKLTAEDIGVEEIEYQMHFPSIGRDVKKIDFREINKGGNWNAYELDVDVSEL